jgi:glucokinase
VSAALGVDIGGTKALAVVVGPDGRVLAEAVAESPRDGAAATLEALARRAGELASVAGLDPSTLPAGIGLAGMVDPAGRLVFSPHLPHLVGADVLGAFARVFRGRCVAVNDADAALVAEWRAGAAAGVADFAMVTLGTGIGGAFVVGGRRLSGRGGFAGEIGHATLVPGGEACPCGRRGCFERYASGEALARYARVAVAAGRAPRLAALGDALGPRGEAVVAAARAGAPDALAVLDEFAHWLALGLANVVATLDVGLVVLGGGLGAEADLFAPALEDDLAHVLEGATVRGPVRVVPAHFAARAGAIGAALIARGDR